MLIRQCIFYTIYNMQSMLSKCEKNHIFTFLQKQKIGFICYIGQLTIKNGYRSSSRKTPHKHHANFIKFVGLHSVLACTRQTYTTIDPITQCIYLLVYWNVFKSQSYAMIQEWSSVYIVLFDVFVSTCM